MCVCLCVYIFVFKSVFAYVRAYRHACVHDQEPTSSSVRFQVQ